MKVSTPDHALTPKSVENAQDLVSVDDRLNETDGADEMNPVIKMYYQDYMQKILMSDGSDPDNQPDW